MKIKGLGITNFRCIDNLEMDNIDTLFTIVAANGHGKSSIVYALQYALFGHCEKTSKSGQKSGALISHGEKSAGIFIAFEHDGAEYELNCKMNRKGADEWGCTQIDGGTHFETRGGMWKALGINEAVACAAAMPHQWMESSDAGELIAGLFMPKDVAVQMLDFIDEKVIEYDEPGVVNVRPGPFWEYCKTNKFPLVTLDDFRSAGAVIFGERTGLKRELSQAKADLELMPPQSLPRTEEGQQLTLDNVGDLEDGITETETRLDDLLRQEGAEQGAPDMSALPELKKKVLAARKEYMRMFGDLEDQEKALNVPAPGDGPSSGIAAQIDALGTEDECGTCGQPLKASALSNRENKRSKLKSKLATATGHEDNMRSIREDIGDRTELTRYACTELQELESEVKAIRNSQADLAENQTCPADELHTEIEEARAKIHRGKDLLQRLDQYNQREISRAYVKTTEATVKWMTTAIDAYKGGKAENALVEQELGPLLDKVNKSLQPFGLDILIEANGKVLEFNVQDGDKGYTPFKLCCTSEQALCAFWVAWELADGNAIMMLDDVNHLDITKRTALLEMMEKTPPESTVLLAWAEQNKTNTEGE